MTAVQVWEEHKTKTLSCDEKTGMQALERATADIAMKPGQVRKQEYEYIRHGTRCLIANWDVVLGKIIAPSISPSRTAEDFQKHIQQTIESDPTVNQWRFVVDNLNTHQSEELVNYVADLMGLDREKLGKKGKSGILKSMKSRAQFLKNKEHPLYFVYTPKHCSWLNQIEIWFGILTKKLLKNGNFKSSQDLENQVEKFICYFNQCLAKPFKWTYDGMPCKS